MGWRRTVSVPYLWTIDLAISKDGGETFTRFSEGPIMSVDYNDPYLLVAPRAIFFENELWHMFYASGNEWMDINWIRNKTECIDKVYNNESQGACCILKKDNIYHAFFSYRHSVDFRNKERGYLLGHAWSENLETWFREDDKNVIEQSEEGWDSEMLCYPNIVNLNGKILMLYCGNGFGQGGLGYAELNIQE